MSAAEQRYRKGTKPAAPPAGYVTVYARNDNTLWALFSDDSELPALVGNIHKKQSFTLTPTDISNGYVDLDFEVLTDSLLMFFNGLVQAEGLEYNLSLAGSVTRLTFAGSLAAGDGALQSGDVIYVQYHH